jgi:hypothetical protein
MFRTPSTMLRCSGDILPALTCPHHAQISKELDRHWISNQFAEALLYKAVREAETGSSAAFPDAAGLREAEKRTIREHSELKAALQHIDSAQRILGKLQTDPDKLPFRWVGVDQPGAVIRISRSPDSFRESLYNLAQRCCHSISFLMDQATEQLRNASEQEEVLCNVLKRKFNSTEAEQQPADEQAAGSQQSLLAGSKTARLALD